jgi:mono/diheme cytochrome c family protein
MKKLALLGLGILLVVGLTACNNVMNNLAGYSMGSGPGMGPGSGMMARHHAAIPQAYAGLTSPVPPNEESLARGAEIYSTNCAACHGDGGMGDGPVATGLNPAPAPVAHTSQMLRDDYLFWRISEGGAVEPFNSTMVSWKATLDELARWDTINYMRALGRGQIRPRQVMGGAAFDPNMEATMRAEMLADAVTQNVLTQEEANLFNRVHTAMDDLIASSSFEAGASMAQAEEAMLAELVKTGQITQAQADAFNNFHDKLVEASLKE